MQMDFSFFNIQFNHVAILYQSKIAANSRFGRNMQYNRSIRGATHSSITDAYHVFDPFFKNFFWQRHITYFGHAGITNRSNIFQYHHTGFINIQVGIVYPCMIIFDTFKHYRPARVFH